MPIGTLADVGTLVRNLLTDLDIAGGDLFTDAFIAPVVKSVWDDLMKKMSTAQVPAAEKITHFMLPAYTNNFNPLSAGVRDLGDVILLEEADSPDYAADISQIVNISGQFPVIRTAGPHNITDFTRKFYIYGVLSSYWCNGVCFAELVDADDIRLKGIVSPSTVTHIEGGTILSGNFSWSEVVEVGQLSDSEVSSSLGEYEWRGDSFWFNGCDQIRTLRLTYRSSSSAPSLSTDSLIYPNILNALAYRTAAILAYPRSRKDAERWDRDARGPALDGGGGFYYDFINEQVKQLQSLPIARRLYPPDHLADVYYGIE